MVIVTNEIRWFSLVISILGGLSKDVEGACWLFVWIYIDEWMSSSTIVGYEESSIPPVFVIRSSFE